MLVFGLLRHLNKNNTIVKTGDVISWALQNMVALRLSWDYWAFARLAITQPRLLIFDSDPVPLTFMVQIYLAFSFTSICLF